MSRLVWSTGEEYPQSSRFINESNETNKEKESNEKKRENQIQSDKSNDYYRPNDIFQENKTFQEMERVNNFIHPSTDLVRNKQREKFDFQIADREMFPQRGTNPFFTNSSYADQITTQSDMLLKTNGNDI